MSKQRKRTIRVVISALFAGFGLAAFAIFGWGVELGAVTKNLIVMILLFFSIAIPAAIFLLLCKTVAHFWRRARGDE